MQRPQPSLRDCRLAIVCVTLSALLSLAVHERAQLSDLAMIHLLGIVFLSLRSSVRVSVIASMASIALFDFLYVAPVFAFAWTDIRSGLTFGGMLVVAVVVSTLSENLRRQEEEARATAFRARALCDFNLELSTARDVRQLAAINARHLKSLFQAVAIVLLQSPDGTLEPFEDTRSATHAHAAWIRRETVRRPIGDGMEIWVPLVGTHSTLGVVGLELSTWFDRDAPRDVLLSACVNQFATAIERAQLASAVQRTQLEAEGERLRSSLLSAVSHDLKTPLATMIAAGTTLLSQGAQFSDAQSRQLLGAMVREGERLSRLVHNLLCAARLESPTIELRRTPESIEDIMQSALHHFDGRSGAPRIQSELVAELPLISAEPVLLEQVLVNLLENAARHAGPGAHVTLSARASASTLSVQVADDGPGIPEAEREKVFEKFYRGSRAPKSDGGVGLGLTICRAIVRAHGGKIGIRERGGGGTLVEFTVPLAQHSGVAAEEVPRS